MANQKTMRTRCLGGFSVMWVPKLLLLLTDWSKNVFVMSQEAHSYKLFHQVTGDDDEMYADFDGALPQC